MTSAMRRANPTAMLLGENLMAVNFAVRHRDRLRHVAAWGCWMAWDGVRWRPDSGELALALACDLCRTGSGAARRAFGRQQAERIASHLDTAAAAAAVAQLARVDQNIRATPDRWDADLDLLNTPAGIVDTRTGEVRAHRGDAWMTRLTAVGPATPGTPCPLWWRFIERVTGGDAELQFYLQRVAGYALTGHGSEHVLFFLHGSGANGKSTFVNALAGILGDYARTVPMKVFARGDGRDADRLAALASARLLTAPEAEDGRGWSETRIKALTGGDAIAARFQGEDFFNFTPQFKLLFAGNRMPGLARVDEAIRRRFHRIPFDVTIPEAERDPELPNRLRAEYPAILRWAIEGAMSWRSLGLATAAGVRRASERYLEAEDSFAQWCAECAEPSPEAWVSSGDLFASWKAWAAATGEAAGSKKRFGQTLEERGFKPRRYTGGRRGYVGLRLLRPQAATAETHASHASLASLASLSAAAGGAAGGEVAGNRD